MPIAKKEDGGYTALKGFYFQMLTQLASNIHTTLEIEKDMEAGVSEDEEPSFYSVRFGFEIHDADGAEVIGKTVRIIQVKFSDTPEAHPIGPSEATEIFEKMVEFANKYFPSDYTHELKLVTNRDKSPDIKKFEIGEKESLRRKAPSTKENPNPDPEYYEYPWLEANLSSIDWKITTEADCKRIIEECGKAYGVLGNYDRGELFKNVAEVWRIFWEGVKQKQGWITPEELMKAFVGHPNPWRLDDRPKELNSFIETGLEHFRRKTQTTLDAASNIVRRDLIADIESALEQYRIVIVEGEGGNGKSTLLAQVASHQSSKRFVAGEYAHDLVPLWPTVCVARWRNKVITVPEEPASIALERLPSTESSRPSSIFALDALDEQNHNEGRVSDLLLDFQSFPPHIHDRATLLISCRKREFNAHLQQLSETESWCKVIRVGNFNPRDVLINLKSNSQLGTSVIQELRLALQQKQNSENESEMEGFVNRRKSPISDSTLEFLLHPVVWRLFCVLELVENERLSILKGEEEAWTKLSRGFIEWFLLKCQKRTLGQFHEVKYDALQALLKIGSAFPDSSVPYLRREWDRTLGNSTIELQLFNHCLSAGLIKDNDPHDFVERPRTWQWRHPFVPRYLHNLSLSQDSDSAGISS